MAKDFNKQAEKTKMPELDPAYRATVFEEVALGYSEEDAINEAKRCIQCPKAPCMEGCPVGVHIPQFIEQIAQGNFEASFDILKADNSLPAICGRVCPQETQCEGKCTRAAKGEAVGVGRLERFVADWAAQNKYEAGASFEQSCEGKNIACVGSGPASITCAGELAKRGAHVTIFEALHKVGGVLTYGIPEFRLPKALVQQEIATVESMGVSLQPNAIVGKLYDLDELMEDKGFDAVFIGTGAGVPRYMNIEGESLNGVMTANELLTRTNLMKAYKFPEYTTPVFMGKKCVVVGGGNVAMDAARTAKRLGADVTIVYRRGMEEMPAREEEIHHAQEEGINFNLLTNPTKIIGDEKGWVTGIECVKMELGEPDESGRRRPQAIEGSEFVIDTQAVIIAVGSTTNKLITQSAPQLETTSRNLIVADSQTGATNIEGVFAGGDVVIGAATVIEAMGAGKRAAQGIIDYLKQKA